MRTAARVDTDGMDRLTVVTGRLTRPLGAGEVKRVPLGIRKDEEPLGRVMVRGLSDGIEGVVVTVDPLKLEGRL